MLPWRLPPLFQFRAKVLSWATFLKKYPKLLDADDVPQDDDVNNGTVQVKKGQAMKLSR